MAVDLNLLTHLTDKALATEAEKRGLTPKGKSREELIQAIRACPAASRPSASPTSTPSPQRSSMETRVPPVAIVSTPRRPARATPIKRARAFLGRVMGLARSALRANEIRTKPAQSEAANPSPKSNEPIRTRTLAELLVQQGQIERAIGIYRDLIAKDGPSSGTTHRKLQSRLRELEYTLHKKIAKQAAADALRHKVGPCLEILERGHARSVLWKLDEQTLKRGQALIGIESTVALRVVTIRRGPGHSIKNQQEDHTEIAREGSMLIDSLQAHHMVISIGLKSESDFISLLHRTYAPAA